ncbi:MAG TPA: hypothetical protein VIV11_33285 [Kofleriaceae bacterium]
MEFLIVVAAITGTVIGLVGRIPDPRKVKRELASAKIQSIDSLVDGKPAAVRGTVTLLEPTAFVVSPWTQQRCVYWLLVFDEVGVAGDFHELGRIDGGVSFLLHSDHGAARVVPDRPRLALPSQAFLRPIMHAQDLLKLAAGSKLKRHNYDTSFLRVTLYTLASGAFVTVKGWCTREPNPEATDEVSGYREQLPTRPVISGTRRAKLLIG